MDSSVDLFSGWGGGKNVYVYLLTSSILYKSTAYLGGMMYSSVLFIIGWANTTGMQSTCDRCCVLCLYCDASSCRCSCMGSIAKCHRMHKQHKHSVC